MRKEEKNMPKLKCKVDQCAYNKTGLCAKNYIDVDGPEASSKKETSCKSYLFKDVENKVLFFDAKTNIVMLLNVYMKKVNVVMRIE